MLNISQDFQEDLNAPLSGKAINTIRLFPNNGLLIWGVRTLDGNSTDWRYINIKRTTIFLEQSIKQGIKDYEYEPNTANTWVSIKSMIQNFLTNLWKQGGLMGSSPSDAYAVNVGLGSTMTAEDILKLVEGNGIDENKNDIT